MTATVLQCDREAAGCPWCDDPPEISSNAQRTIIACRNHYCLADASAEGETREEALTIWNTRHDSTRDLVEALQAIGQRGPERDKKWAGMTARDIALATLQGTER